ncbi:MAG: TonB-dependent receptor [Bacteroidota bacterium]|nr:TonB-dependent receptor [Bacteroidota bacterium]
MKLKRILPLLFVAFLFPFIMNAQVTTSSIVGTVKSEDGAPLAGATIKATHVPSGTVYATTAQADGQFTIPNMRVGGPYKVDVSYVGYKAKEFNDLQLALGTPLSINAELISEAKSLSEVVVALNQNAVMSPKHEGAVTQISQQQLQDLPTISRSVADFTRLTPQAVTYNSGSDGSSLGTSFGGANNRYNQFTIDGANATDVFGLAASGTNGGQAGTNPIPLDAIEQVQVVLSPYDVTEGGFTGGGINAVTRSGTNNFHGSLYSYYQNQSMVGKSVTTGNKLDKFTDKTLGFRLGGPIVKNKLFFFVNAELYKRSQPLGYNPAETGSGSQFNIGALDSISTFLKSSYGYDPGSYTNFNKDRKSNSVFARIDWNISEKSKLTLRHSYEKSNDYNISRSAKSITFGNAGYHFQDVTNSSVLELNTNISSRSSNMLRITYNRIRDNRFSSPLFPSITIKAAGGLTYNIGGEQYSSANQLNQDNFTLTDNYSIYAGKHTFTFGTDNQFYNTTNVFLRAFYGAYQYSSVNDFVTGAIPDQYHVSYSNVSDPNAPGKIHFAQFGVYGQDQYDASENFHLTYGLRIDLPAYFNKPSANSTFNSSQIAIDNNVATNKVPKSALLLSPRIGFNYDVNGKHQTQLRGGIGLFTGRIPFVWISNQYSNTGVESIKFDDYSPTAAEVFNYDPKGAHLGAYIPSNPASAPSEIDITSHNFKVPRTLRANLAVDQKLPWGLIGTIEGVFTKTLDDIAYQDINTAAPAQSIKIGNSTRPQYSSTPIDSRFGRVIMLKNTNKGYSYNFTAQVQRSFKKGFTGSIAYNLGHSYSLNDGTSSQAVSNWRYVYTVNGLNDPSLTRSNYDPGSRVIAYVTKVFKYGPLYTSLGLVYTGQSGQTFSYAYYGDVNGDDPGNSNDIMYVPASQAEAQLVYPNDWANLEAFINSDSYLKAHQGQVLERNGNRTPWENHFDIKLAEGWNIYKTNKLEFTVDVFNVGNLLNKKWGRSYYVSYQETEPITLAKTSQWISPTQPTFTFNPKYATDVNTGKAWGISDFTSRWNMKIGLRYTF